MSRKGKNRTTSRRREAWYSGLIWLPWTIVLGLVIALTVVTFNVYRGHSDLRTCEDNMYQIYLALEQYNSSWGALPEAQFYAHRPSEEEDSLLNILKPYGIEDIHFICEGVPEKVNQEGGVSYLWNTELNKKSLNDFVQNPQWMLIEITALNEEMDAPHFDKYNVLFTDGEVRLTREIPAGVQSPNTAN